MGEHRERAGGRRYRRRHRLQRQQSGVVAVVGTLLSLLVFLGLFGVFLTQFLPLWMTDNEAEFVSQSQASMATLKSNIDLQTSFSGPPIYATPFVMSSQGVPLLAQPTPGVLNFIPSQPGVFANVSVTPGPGGGSRFFQNYSLGTLQFVLPNRYYSPQTFEFEDDAVIQSQSDTQQLVVFPPALAVNVSGNQIGVTLTLLQLLGNATQTVSTGTQEVYSHFLFADSYTSNTSGNTVKATVLLGTHFPCAWATFLAQTFSNAGISSHVVLTPNTCVASKGNSIDVSAVLTGLNSFTLVVAESELAVGVGLE
jgi:hypothetical protein